jgi:hypothetical protein
MFTTNLIKYSIYFNDVIAIQMNKKTLVKKIAKKIQYLVEILVFTSPTDYMLISFDSSIFI